ncbi:transcriptional regulator [uncultured Stenotrophomonas sp.]|uniref:helix-turn-helix domain-containing protein n=1 Tax=uncultured Stenotrophomonas sp. TaxID=165438 RepID=UPI0028D3EF53|nr:transcriptional regulator [uncultured Stenotrophomonas sp.]
MNIRPLHSERDYHEAKQKLAAWFDDLPEPGTEQGDMFEVLLILVANYESTHFPLDAPDPIEAIKFRMAQERLEAKDLVDVIGQKNRVYEVLTGKRKLTLEMIRRVRDRMNISADVLIGH